MSSLTLLLSLLLLSGTPSAAISGTSPGQSSQEIDIDRAREAAYTVLVADLLELAEWCTKKKIFIERKGIFEDVLHFDPGNEVAKRGLGFVKGKDGKWVATERRVPLKNWDRAAARKLPARRVQVTAKYRETMVGLLEKHAEKLTPAQLDAILEDLLVVDPDDGMVHAMRGEVKLEERWVLEETALAKARRGELRKIVKNAFGTAPEVRMVKPNEREQAFGIDWTAVCETPVVRVLGTGEKKEIQRLPDAMHAALVLFHDALSLEGHYPESFTVFALAGEGDADLFLNHHPSIDEGYRKFLSRLDGSLIQGCGDNAHWSLDEQRRADGLVRQAISWLLVESCGVSTNDGWLHEGLGLYMTRELVGTRLTWYVEPSSYLVPEQEQALKAKLLDTRTNWMSEANKLFQSGKRPRLAFFLGKTVNTLTVEEILYSYVLTAFLLEARGEVLPGLLRSIGSETPSQEALEKALGMSIIEIDELVCRWLVERF
jgi:hypothetical protein